MKIVLSIESTDPQDLVRVANALAGNNITLTSTAPSAEPAAKAEPKPRVTKAELVAEAPKAATVETAPAIDQPRVAETPTVATITAAANAAVAKMGPSGASKIKAWIAETFTQPNGQPGTLMLTAEDQRYALLAGLQELGQGVKQL